MNTKTAIYLRKSEDESAIADLSKNAQGKLLMGVLAVVNEYHREILSLRVKRGIQAKKESTKSKLK